MRALQLPFSGLTEEKTYSLIDKGWVPVIFIKYEDRYQAPTEVFFETKKDNIPSYTLYPLGTTVVNVILHDNVDLNDPNLEKTIKAFIAVLKTEIKEYRNLSTRARNHLLQLGATTVIDLVELKLTHLKRRKFNKKLLLDCKEFLMETLGFNETTSTFLEHFPKDYKRVPRKPRPQVTV